MSLRRVANQKHFAGVNPQDWWDFKPGQRVMTREGFAGVVTAVDDGPFPGNENYRVTLDNGMGGGDYSSSELRSISGANAAQAPAQGAVTETGAHTADSDYPELSQILYDRPPLQHEQRISSRRTAFDSADDWMEWEVQDLMNKGMSEADARREAQENYENNWWDQDDPVVRTGSSELPPFDLSEFLAKDAGIHDWLSQHPGVEDAALIGGGAWLMNQRRNNPHFQDTKNPDDITHSFSVDWCRYRKNSRCMYPKHLDVEATEKAGPGYTVWQAADRGYCPRRTWDDQKACPLSGPGPDSGEPNALPAANREGHYYWNKTSSLLAPGDGLGFHMTASWQDVQAKAREIRKAGKVRVLSVLPGQITAQVEGTENVYQTTLVRVPGRKQTATWECGCAWAAYSWGRTGRWKRYEGRMCSHALALTYEAQSRGMFGKEIHEDRDTPHWLDPTIPVKQDGDWDKNKGRYSSKVAALTEGDRVVTEWGGGVITISTGRSVTIQLDSGDKINIQRGTPGFDRIEKEIDDSTRDYAMGRGGSLPADIPPIIAMAADMVDQGFDPSDIIRGFQKSLGAERSRFVVQAAISIEAYKGLIDGREQDFTIDDGKVFVHGQEIPAGEVLFPEWDPSAGLHFTGAKEATSLDDRLVDYKPDRKLSDPDKTRAITDVLPEARETLYSQMPFLNEMHKAMGADPEGDVNEYMDKRNSFFKSQPLVNVPLDYLVVTQHAVNTDRVKQMQDQPETRGKGNPYFVRYNGETYAINGHHRVVQEALDGSPDIKGHLWNLDRGHIGGLLDDLQAEDGPLDDDETVLEGAEPEPALPSVEESITPPAAPVAETHEARIARLQAGMSWINKDSGKSGGGKASGNYSDSDIAEAARAALAKTGAKKFSPSEKARIIGEGVGVQASNLDRLDIKGTHYEALEGLGHDPDEEILF